MAWNEPGGNNRDPWGGNGRDKGPPDLDEIFRKLSGKFGGLLGNKRGGGSGDGPSGPSRTIRFNMFGFGLGLIILLAIWLLSGIYIVEQGKQGVELRFGKFSAITDPGLSYHWPYPVESVEIVDVAQRRAETVGYQQGDRISNRSGRSKEEALMLTEDENIVDVQLSIQYQIKDPRNYLFAVQDPDATLRQVIESALREVVGKSTMDFVLTEGRADIVAEVKDLSQTILDQYQTGLIITNVNLQDAQPPDEVQEAFADAIKAREDEQRVINEAEAYRNEVLPRARGEAARQLQEADAYKEQVIAQAEGEARRFEQLLTEYAKAPEVTRERLYLETLETVMTNTSKVLIDAEGGNNLIYLPLDRLMNRTGERSTGRDNLNGPSLARDLPVPQRSDSSSTRLRETNRSRETR
jgi:membrane protease subunit HflK